MIDKSFIVITHNSEKYIHDVLCSLLPLQDNEELIIFDNHSKDQSVPNIISTIDPMMWVDERTPIKFYINTKETTYKETKDKALSKAQGKPVIVKKRSRFKIEELEKC